MNRYRHIVWDWNGTLLDDARDCVAIVSGMMQRRGLGTLSLERYRREVEFPIVRFYEKLGFDFTRESFDSVADEYIRSYQAALPQCRLQAGAAAALMALEESGYSHSVLSAYQQKPLEEAAAHFGLAGHFIRLIGSDDYYARGKVDNGRRWIGALPFAPAQVVMVGDMLHDHEVARAMGIDCILLTGGHQCQTLLARCGVPVLDGLPAACDWLAARIDPAARRIR